MPPTSTALLEQQLSSHEQVTDSDQILHSVNLELRPETVATTLNLKVFADTLIIKDTLTLPSKDVFIHARKVIAVSNAAINVTRYPR